MIARWSLALIGNASAQKFPGRRVSLCVGQGSKITYKNFDTFCPKAIAGIGVLPDTITDRSIPIRLKRRVSSERIERFRYRDAKPEAAPLAKQLEEMSGLSVVLREARPALPQSLGDRQQEAIEPLLAIADLAGGCWPEKARASFLELFGVETGDISSVRMRLLADLRAVLWRKINAGKEPGDRIASKELLRELTSEETSEWADWDHGKGLSPSALAKFLRPYGISPKTIRMDGETMKGYEWRDFVDAWERYLPDNQSPSASLDPPSQPLQPSQNNLNASDTHFLEPSQLADVTSQETEQLPANTPVVTAVTASRPENEQEARR